MKVLSPSQVKLLNVLKKHNGEKTIAEIAAELGLKPGSMTTALSNLRSVLREGQGVKLGKFEPKKNRGGGGRTASVDSEAVASALEGLEAIDASESVVENS